MIGRKNRKCPSTQRRFNPLNAAVFDQLTFFSKVLQVLYSAIHVHLFVLQSLEDYCILLNKMTHKCFVIN